MDEPIPICPECGSTNTTFKIQYDGGPMRRCRECGCERLAFPEVPKDEVESFREQLKKYSVSQNTSTTSIVHLDHHQKT